MGLWMICPSPYMLTKSTKKLGHHIIVKILLRQIDTYFIHLLVCLLLTHLYLQYLHSHLMSKIRTLLGNF